MTKSTTELEDTETPEPGEPAVIKDSGGAERRVEDDAEVSEACKETGKQATV